MKYKTAESELQRFDTGIVSNRMQTMYAKVHKRKNHKPHETGLFYKTNKISKISIIETKKELNSRFNSTEEGIHKIEVN